MKAAGETGGATPVIAAVLAVIAVLAASSIARIHTAFTDPNFSTERVLRYWWVSLPGLSPYQREPLSGWLPDFAGVSWMKF